MRRALAASHDRSGLPLRAALVALLVAASGVLAVPSVLARTHKSAHCSAPAHVHVLAHTSHVIAWSRHGKPSGGNVYTTVHACSPPHGKTRVVTEWAVESGSYSGQQEGAEDVETAGDLLGLDDDESDQTGETDQLIVFNTKSGRTVFNKTVGNEQYQIDQPTDCSPCFNTYAIDSRGDVAWIVSTGEQGPTPNINGEVLRLRTAAGVTSTLATATTLAYLEIADGSVTWTADGVAASAPLPGATGSSGATGT
jgi:hypothetical protein